MRKIPNYTQHDLLELGRHGREFLALARGGKSFGEKKPALRAWAGELERFKEAVDPSDRFAFEMALEPLRALFGGAGAVTQDALVGSLAHLVPMLDQARTSYELPPTQVDNEEFGRFLRACQFKNDDLAPGEPLELRTILKIAHLPEDHGRRCLARALDEHVAQLNDTNNPDAFGIDTRALAFVSRELEPRRKSRTEPPPPPDDLGRAHALLARWEDAEARLSFSARENPNVMLESDAPVLSDIDELEADALTLIARHAPHFQGPWAAREKTAVAGWREIETSSGGRQLLRVAQTMRDRLPYVRKLVEALEQLPGGRKVSTPGFLLPEAHERFRKEIEAFHRDDPYERSVFVMMKFPSNDMEPWQKKCLDDIFGAIASELSRFGLVARRADQKTYATTAQLWDNLCIYMLGCRYGVAVLEDHVGNEFNPNVAMEYGFMRALGRDLVLLKEAGFSNLRADFVATIPREFEIDASHVVQSESVMDGIEHWMIDLAIPPKRKRS